MNDARAKTGLDLSLAQLVAGTGAALTAALLGSLFGIAGTLLGTAVGSTVATICTAVYTHQLRRTHDRLQRRGFRATWPRPSALRRLPWLRVLPAAAVIFGLALAALTVIESLAGRPLSSATGGSHAHAAGRTSLSRILLRPDLPDHLPAPRPVGSTTPAGPAPEQPSPPRPASDASPTPAAAQRDGEAPISSPPHVASPTPSHAATPTPTGSETPPSDTSMSPSADPTRANQPTVPPPSAQPSP